MVSVPFYRGQVCGLIGPNGAGKTTYFDCLSGVRTPTSGTIEFDGQQIGGRSATWRARHGIRRTFQRQQTFGWLTVEENLLVALEWRGGGGGGVGGPLPRPPPPRQGGGRPPGGGGGGGGGGDTHRRGGAPGEAPARGGPPVGGGG